MPGKQPIFPLDANKLLAKVRRMNARAQKEREARARDDHEHIKSLRVKVEEARKEVMRYRNEKTAPEFRQARSALEEARMTLRDTLASTTDEAKTRELVQRLQESKQKLHENKFSQTTTLRRSVHSARHKASMKNNAKKKHTKVWNFSTDASKIIPRPFAPLGPSNPSLLRPEGTRFGATNPKVPWRAVPEGLLFGYTEPPNRQKRRHSASSRPETNNENRKQTSTRGAHGAGAAAGASPGAGGGAGSGEDPTDGKPRWRAADAVSRIFSQYAYNRPMTAHERALSKKMATPERHLFVPRKVGKAAWKPTSRVSGPFNPIVYAEDNTGGGAGGGVGARSRRGLGSTFDGASAAGFDR